MHVPWVSPAFTPESLQVNTIPVCMVATGHLALRVATFAKLATRVLKYTIYSNFGAFSPTGPKIWSQIQPYVWQLAWCYVLHPLI